MNDDFRFNYYIFLCIDIGCMANNLQKSALILQMFGRAKFCKFVVDLFNFFSLTFKKWPITH